MGSRRLTRRRRAAIRKAAEKRQRARAAVWQRRRKFLEEYRPFAERHPLPYKKLTWRRVRLFLADELPRVESRELHGLLNRLFPAFFWYRGEPIRRLRKLLLVVAFRAPRLLEERFAEPFRHIAREAWIRPLADWRPRGKSRERLLRSLVDHLLVEYPVPRFLYGVFDGRDGSSYDSLPRDTFRAAASGESLYAFFKRHRDAPVMTRRMCHLFTSMPDGMSFYEAVRTAQVGACGGGPALARSVCFTHLGLHSSEPEAFWLEAIGWLAGRDDWRGRGLINVFDYLSCNCAHRPGFSFKGRSFAAIERAAREWHRELVYARVEETGPYEPSGFACGSWIARRKSSMGGIARSRWTVEEILRGKDLAEEGRRMRHCVASYGNDIADKRCSIWSLRRNGERRLTVEVDNRSRQVVQARGCEDRDPLPFEKRVIDVWARKNGLRVRLMW